MRNIVLAAAALALVGIASPGLASGSGASGGGASPQFRGGAGNLESRELRELQRQFRRGRSQVRKRITCKECAHYKKLNRETAPEVARNVIDGKYGMKDEDRTAVLIYLRDRYDL